MDISVSRLNGRLASKLPPELPLGLVFVVGKVSQVGERRFVLLEELHRLSCRAVDDLQLREGDEVRASGHLMFDPEKLQYYLLARDVEVITSEPLNAVVGNSRELLAESEDLLSALAAVKARAAATPTEKSDEMPLWVKKLAPPEVRTEEIDEDAVDGEGHADTATAPKTRTVALDEGLVSMLSAAMDSEDELELTPELLAPYTVEAPEPAQPDTDDETIDGRMDTAVPDVPTSYRPTNRQDTDWLVILLIISFFVLTIAAVVTIVLLLIQ